MPKQKQLSKRDRAAKRRINASRKAYGDARKPTTTLGRDLYPEWYSLRSRSTL